MATTVSKEAVLHLNDIFIAATAVAGATAAKETGVAPEWVSHGIAAVTGAGIGAGFRFFEGHFKNLRQGMFSWIVGVAASYYGAMLIVRGFGLEHSLEVPLTFFLGTFIAGAIRALATGIDFNKVIQKAVDKVIDSNGGSSSS